MRNEIGSEFCSPLISGEKTSLLPENALLSKCGRAALEDILFDIQTGGKIPKTVLMPSYCCGSMLLPFLKRGIDIDFYSVTMGKNGGLEANITKRADIVLVLDYFGFCSEGALPSLPGIIVRDVTHSLLSDRINTDTDYVFGSLRKWDAFATGGFAYKKSGQLLPSPQNQTVDSQYISLRETAQKQKSDYLSGKSEDKGYLGIFSKAEELLDEDFTGTFSQSDRELLDKIDWNEIKKRRRENAKMITAELKDICLFKEIKDGDVPLCVPVILPCDKRNALRKHLINNGIYCPIHWPRPEQEGVADCEIYDMELSLICDQRYGEKDILREIKCVKEFLKNF